MWHPHRRAIKAGPPPLAGIRIADFSRVLAGPLCSMMLAEYGAEVIKIESRGDDTRAWIPPVAADGAGTYFASVNRNKKSVIAGLTSDDGVSYARGLVAGCDVVIENFRPGVMAKYGLDYQTVAKDRPDIVYCSISGFGTGAGANLPGYDLLVQALGGLMSITGFPEAMSAIYKHGSDEQKAEWLPTMARGEAIGCLGLTEPTAGSDPGSMRTFARRDGAGWVLNGSKRWIGLASVAKVAIIWAQTDGGVRGFVVPTSTPGFTATPIDSKLSMRASIQCDIELSEVRLPGNAVLPNVVGLKGPSHA